MGKVAKKDNDGKPSLIKFKEDKSISLVIDGDKLKLIEIGMMDMEVGTICTKDIRLFDQVVDVLLKCDTLGEARVRANVIKLHTEGGEQQKEEPKQATPYPRNKPLAHWENFQNLAKSCFPGLSSIEVPYDDCKEAVREAICAYLDKMNQNHKMVAEYVEKINKQDDLRDPKDRIWIFKEMYILMEKAPGCSINEQSLREDYRAYAKSLIPIIGPHLYNPTDYPSDFDAAEELLHAAENYWNMGKNSDAISMTEQAIGAAVNCLDAYYQLAEYHILQHDFKGAVEAIARIEEMPLAPKVLKDRLDYFVLYAKLCHKIDNKDIAEQQMARLKTMAGKYEIPMDQIPA